MCQKVKLLTYVITLISYNSIALIPNLVFIAYKTFDKALMVILPCASLRSISKIA